MGLADDDVLFLQTLTNNQLARHHREALVAETSQAKDSLAYGQIAQTLCLMTVVREELEIGEKRVFDQLWATLEQTGYFIFITSKTIASSYVREAWYGELYHLAKIGKSNSFFDCISRDPCEVLKLIKGYQAIKEPLNENAIWLLRYLEAGAYNAAKWLMPDEKANCECDDCFVEASCETCDLYLDDCECESE